MNWKGLVDEAETAIIVGCAVEQRNQGGHGEGGLAGLCQCSVVNQVVYQL